MNRLEGGLGSGSILTNEENQDQQKLVEDSKIFVVEDTASIAVSVDTPAAAVFVPQELTTYNIQVSTSNESRDEIRLIDKETVEVDDAISVEDISAVINDSPVNSAV